MSEVRVFRAGVTSAGGAGERTRQAAAPFGFG